MSLEMENLLELGVTLESLPPDHQKNLLAYLPKLQRVELEYGKNLLCTNGYRTMAHHLEIYEHKNAERIYRGEAPLKIPMKSQHLFGHAADFFDKDRALAHWALDHLELMEELGLYFEALESTPNWLHIQDVAPGSGKRFFNP